MIQNIVLTLILLVIIGCGAQSKTDDEGIKNDLVVADSTPSSAPSALPAATPLLTPTATPVPSVISSLLPLEEISSSIESSELPKEMGITLPNSLNKSSKLEFIKDFNEVKKVQEMAFLNLSLMSQLMPKIVKKCAGLITCHFEVEAFSVKYKEENIILDKIAFQQDSKNKHYQYELIVTNPFSINNFLSEGNDSITYRWTSSQQDIWSFYHNEENNITLRYFIDANSHESMIINNQKVEERITFLVTKQESSYHISLNHISKNTENFSSNILLEDEMIIEENENIIQLTSTNENLKEGNYILLPPKTSVEKLTLKNILDLTEGVFSIFNEQFQGFLYDDKFLSTLDTLIIVELSDNDRGFKVPNKDFYLY